MERERWKGKDGKGAMERERWKALPSTLMCFASGNVASTYKISPPVENSIFCCTSARLAALIL
jgi:hypothetical protein